MLSTLDDNIAKELNIGKTRIKICTNYCVKNKDEIRNILNNIAKNSLPNIDTFALKENS